MTHLKQVANVWKKKIEVIDAHLYRYSFLDFYQSRGRIYCDRKLEQETVTNTSHRNKELSMKRTGAISSGNINDPKA